MLLCPTVRDGGAEDYVVQVLPLVPTFKDSSRVQYDDDNQVHGVNLLVTRFGGPHVP